MKVSDHLSHCVRTHTLSKQLVIVPLIWSVPPSTNPSNQSVTFGCDSCVCSEELDKFMESQGASSPGILTLTTSLSKPFMRLDKYPTLLQELERHVEVRQPQPGEDYMCSSWSSYWSVVRCDDFFELLLFLRKPILTTVTSWKQMLPSRTLWCV